MISAPAVHMCSVSLFGQCLGGVNSESKPTGTAVPIVPHTIGKYPAMHFTQDQLDEMRRRINLLPKYSAPNVSGASRMIVTHSVNLLPYITYNPSDRNQNNCGNCYRYGHQQGPWKSSMLLMMGYIRGFPSSISAIIMGTGPSGQDNSCGGGWPGNFADLYNNKLQTSSWSNTNAYWGDYNDPENGDGFPGPTTPVFSVLYRPLQRTN